MATLVEAIRNEIAMTRARLEKLQGMEDAALELDGDSPVSGPPPAPVRSIAAARKTKARSSAPRKASKKRQPARRAPATSAGPTAAGNGTGGGIAGSPHPNTQLEALKVLELRGQASTMAIAEAAGLSRPRMDSALRKLAAAGKIVHVGQERGPGGGRPGNVWRLPDANDRTGAQGIGDGEKLRPELKDRVVAILEEHGARQGLDVYEMLTPQPTDSAFAAALGELVKEGRVKKLPANGRLVYQVAVAA